MNILTIRDGGYGYQIAALVCFVVFADNLLRRIEGSGENMLWVSSGRWELIVVSGTLSALMQLVFWSEVVDRWDSSPQKGVPEITSLGNYRSRAFSALIPPNCL